MRNRMRTSNMWLVRVPEGGKRNDGVEAIFKGILVMSYP